MLGERGYRVIGVTSSEEALAQGARGMRPAAVLLDVSCSRSTAGRPRRPSRSTRRRATSDRDDERGIRPPSCAASSERSRRVPGRAGRLSWRTTPTSARVLTTILAARGLETRHAGSRDAIRMSEALPPDVLVLDLGLPDLDGLEVVGLAPPPGPPGQDPARRLLGARPQPRGAPAAARLGRGGLHQGAGVAGGAGRARAEIDRPGGRAPAPAGRSAWRLRRHPRRRRRGATSARSRRWPSSWWAATTCSPPPRRRRPGPGGRRAADAILLDVMMPDMDGPTAFERLRADRRRATSRSSS